MPTYIAQPPRQDGWGRPFLFNLDAAAANYDVRSLGRNGAADGLMCGTTKFNEDILFSDGAFLRWPEGAQD